MGEEYSGGVVALRGGGGIDDFEWVNAWALQSDQSAIAAAPPACEAIPEPTPSPAQNNVHVLRAAFAADAVRAATELEALDDSAHEADQLQRDVLAIERARDALSDARVQPPAPTPAVRRWIPLRRTADSVPVVLGSVLGVLMLVVFTAAATFVKLAR